MHFTSIQVTVLTTVFSTMAGTSAFAQAAASAPRAVAEMPSSARSFSHRSALYQAIRRDDTAAVARAIAGHVDVNNGDETGATPLMYASLLAGVDVVRTLVEHGALVNRANTFGSTPLMWAAAGRTANVEFLLKHDADVNAKASDGTTAIAVAARYGNVAAMEALADKGADMEAPATRADLITAAYYTRTDDVRRWLRTRGILVHGNADVKAPVLARNLGNLAALRELFDGGVAPDEQVPLITLSLPSFFMAAREGHLDALKAFVKAGADINFKGPKGWTALMLAAGSDTTSIPVLQYLLDSGGDLNAADADGRTALDWALSRGETEIAGFLRRNGARASYRSANAPAPVVAPRRPADAIRLAVSRLQPVGPAFNNRTKCNSCHNQNIPGMAITAAKRHGIPIDESLAGHSLQASSRNLGGARREAVLLGDSYGGGFQNNALFTLLEMAEAHQPATPLTDALVLGLASHQLSDGSLPLANDIRPPLTGSKFTATVLFIRALAAYAPDGRRAELTASRDKAMAYVQATEPRDTQERVFKMLGLLWGGASRADISSAVDNLVALQRADGGWAQMPTMTSDAYATGEAVWALNLVRASAPSAQKGIAYLLRTQLDDGTWFVQTRAFGFQPYFETGFPHGRSQFISTVATSWASLALIGALENPPSSTSSR